MPPDELRDRGGQIPLHGPHTRGSSERRVLTQDRPLEPSKLRARLDAELLDQRPPRIPVGPERFGLPPRAIESDDQLAPQPLPERLVGHQPLELGDQVGVAARGQVGVDPLLDRRPTELPEALCLDPRERAR